MVWQDWLAISIMRHGIVAGMSQRITQNAAMMMPTRNAHVTMARMPPNLVKSILEKVASAATKPTTAAVITNADTSACKEISLSARQLMAGACSS